MAQSKLQAASMGWSIATMDPLAIAQVIFTAIFHKKYDWKWTGVETQIKGNSSLLFAQTTKGGRITGEFSWIYKGNLYPPFAILGEAPRPGRPTAQDAKKNRRYTRFELTRDWKRVKANYERARQIKENRGDFQTFEFEKQIAQVPLTSKLARTGIKYTLPNGEQAIYDRKVLSMSPGAKEKDARLWGPFRGYSIQQKAKMLLPHTAIIGGRWPANGMVHMDSRWVWRDMAEERNQLLKQLIKIEPLFKRFVTPSKPKMRKGQRPLTVAGKPRLIDFPIRSGNIVDKQRQRVEYFSFWVKDARAKQGKNAKARKRYLDIAAALNKAERELGRAKRAYQKQMQKKKPVPGLKKPLKIWGRVNDKPKKLQQAEPTANNIEKLTIPAIAQSFVMGPRAQKARTKIINSKKKPAPFRAPSETAGKDLMKPSFYPVVALLAVGAVGVWFATR